MSGARTTVEALLLLFAGACSKEERLWDQRAREQPPMPAGMLMPSAVDDPDGGPMVGADRRFAAGRTKPMGASVTFATGREGGASAWFVPLEAMTVLNEVIAPVKAGYDPLVGQRLSGEEIARLDAALAVLETKLLETKSSDEARSRWPGSEPVRTHTQGEWLRVRAGLLTTVRSLRGLVSEAKAAGSDVVLSAPS